jgi:hypothetical protein
MTRRPVLPSAFLHSVFTPDNQFFAAQYSVASRYICADPRVLFGPFQTIPSRARECWWGGELLEAIALDVAGVTRVATPESTAKRATTH